jgi:MFS family permease
VEAPDPRDPSALASTASRPRWATVRLLRANPSFRLLFLASVSSFAGDWFLFVAMAGLVFDLTGSPVLVALVYAANTVPFAVFTFVGGPLADRLDRQKLMVVADLLRGALALGFFLVHSRSQVWAVFVLAAAIAALGAVFEPAAGAAVPNLVDHEDLPSANIVYGATWGTMLAVGAGIGGLLVAAFGRGAGYIGDSVSFFVSAALVSRIRRPFSEPREAHEERPGLFRATREALRYARGDHRVLALLSVKAGFGLSAGTVALLPILALQVFAAGDRGTGVLFGFRGLGVFLGPFLVRRYLRADDLSGLFRAITVSFVTFGLFYALVPTVPGIALAGVMVMAAHLGGGAQWSLSTFGLQVIVPDRVRGRVFAFDEGLITFTVAVSATAAGWLADVFDVRVVMIGLAGVSIGYALLWTAATSRIRRDLPAPSLAPAG